MILRQPVFIVAALAGGMGYGLMNLLMVATPLAMSFCSYPYSAAAMVIEWHVVGMYAPGFFTGSLIRRHGTLKVIVAGVALVAGCVFVALNGNSIPHFVVALALLGVGWNFMYIGGTTLLTESYRPAEKAKTQGANDLIVFSIMGISSFSSGALVSAAGWESDERGRRCRCWSWSRSRCCGSPGCARGAAGPRRRRDPAARRAAARPGGARSCRHPRRQFPNSEERGDIAMEWLASPEAWIALLTLTALEIVLGVDNIIFISILVGRLPPEQRQKARVIGLGLAMFTRIALLMSLAWMMRLTEPLFSAVGLDVTGRALILVGGGLFLLAKSVMEIHGALEGTEEERALAQERFSQASAAIAGADRDHRHRVLARLGDHGGRDGQRRSQIMVLAIVIAVAVMMFAAKPIGDFVDAHPTIKMLALSFLILIGVALIGEGLGMHIPKGYIYFAMAFSVVVEMLNLRLRKKRQPVKLHKELGAPEEPGPR